ncbi:MAG: hypothetical protein ACE5GJ_13215 [Gemmatimonadota bacterium]
MMRIKQFGVLSLLVLPTLGACSGITRDSDASTARVLAEASPTRPLELIVSTDFIVVLDELTGEKNPDYITSDTVMLTGDVDRTYDLKDGDARLFVRLANYEDTVEPVRLRIFLDGQKEYDVSANLGQGGFLEYLYRFNQPQGGF